MQHINVLLLATRPQLELALGPIRGSVGAAHLIHLRTAVVRAHAVGLSVLEAALGAERAAQFVAGAYARGACWGRRPSKTLWYISQLS